MPYRTKYNMLRSPFSPEIEPNALFESQAFQQAQARLDYLRRERAAGAVVGDTGGGKTTCTRAFVSRLALSAYMPLYVPVPNVQNPLKVVVEILLDMMGERAPWLNPGRALHVLNEALAATYEKGRVPFLIIDEAQHLDDRGLLQLKTLLNHGMDSRLPLVFLLSGTPALGRNLMQKKMDELRQRLLFVYPYQGMARGELDDYIRSRLRAAGCDRSLFSTDVLEELYRHTQGIPRQVNQLANLSLIAAASAGKDHVDATSLRHGLAEMGLGTDEANRTGLSMGRG